MIMYIKYCTVHQAVDKVKIIHVCSTQGAIIESEAEAEAEAELLVVPESYSTFEACRLGLAICRC
jgi:hypothetical protein